MASKVPAPLRPLEGLCQSFEPLERPLTLSLGRCTEPPLLPLAAPLTLSLGRCTVPAPLRPLLPPLTLSLGIARRAWHSRAPLARTK